MNREGEPPRVSLGFVVGLDYADARLSVHDVLQEFKLHPLVRKILGERQARGLGREGDPGGRLLGDAARCTRRAWSSAATRGGMVNVPRLKGIHYAIRSGMLAAETIYRAAQGRLDATSPPTSRRCTTPRSARTSTSRAT